MQSQFKYQCLSPSRWLAIILFIMSFPLKTNCSVKFKETFFSMDFLLRQLVNMFIDDVSFTTFTHYSHWSFC